MRKMLISAVQPGPCHGHVALPSAGGAVLGAVGLQRYSVCAHGTTSVCHVWGMLLYHLELQVVCALSNACTFT